MVSNPMDCSARTVVSLECAQRILMPQSIPSLSTSSELQKIVGQPSFFMSGCANSSNVSLTMMACVCARSSSRKSFAPGSGSICAITS